MDIKEQPVLLTGHRVLVKGVTRVAHIIDHVMRHYAWQEKYNAEYTYSHSGTIVVVNGRPRIIEAVANGLCPNLFCEHYSLYLDDIMIVAPNIPYTEEEVDAMTEYALNLVAVNNFYQYWSLLCWLAYVYIAFKIPEVRIGKKILWKSRWIRLNLFGKGNKFSNVCYEASYLIPRHVRPAHYWMNPEHASCYDLYDPRREYIVYRNKPE